MCDKRRGVEKSVEEQEKDSVQKGARKHGITVGELVDRKQRYASACLLEWVAVIAEVEEVARGQTEHAVENQKGREEYDFLVRGEPPTAMIWSESTDGPLTTISPNRIMPQ
jgi:hypothetical protein